MDVSFIIPTHNAAAKITETIEQFKSLRQNQHEVIVCDNHSQDATSTMARASGAKVVMQPADVITSFVECYNTGANIAIGETLWLMLVGTRVVDLEGFVDEVKYYFVHHPDAVAIIPRIILDHKQITLFDNLQLWWRNAEIFIQNRISKTGAAQVGCIIIRRAAFEKIKGFNPQQTGKPINDLMHRLSKLGEIQMFWHRSVAMSDL